MQILDLQIQRNRKKIYHCGFLQIPLMEKHGNFSCRKGWGCNTQVRQFFLKKVPELTISNHVLLLPLPIMSPETLHKIIMKRRRLG